jgi:hypothetical protein
LDVAGVLENEVDIVLREDVVDVGEPECDFVQRQLETTSKSSQLRVNKIAIAAELDNAQEGTGQN